MNRRIALAAALLALLAACGPKEEVSAAGDAPPEAAANADTDAATIAPPIISPDEVADLAAVPSYEVAIASAAANHNTALARCAQQPNAVRSQCEQEANAAFAEARAGLNDLRGNTE